MTESELPANLEKGKIDSFSSFCLQVAAVSHRASLGSVMVGKLVSLKKSCALPVLAALSAKPSLIAVTLQSRALHFQFHLLLG